MVDFLCIGANKSGTTWLHNMLIQHDNVALAKTKEPHYFSRNYDLGEQWYLSLWNKNEERVKGEFSTTYFNSAEALDRIKKDCPDTKLLIILRDPVARAISHLKHLERESIGKDLSAILNSDPTVFTNSCYMNIVSELLQRFNPERILFIQFEKLVAFPEDSILEILDFLGLKRKSNFISCADT